MKAANLLAVCFLLLSLLVCPELEGRQLGRGLFKSDVVHNRMDSRGDTDAAYALYFCDLGKMELCRLKDLEKQGVELDDIRRGRLLRLESALEPINKLKLELRALGRDMSVEERAKFSEKIDELMCSKTIGESIYLALGEEGCSEAFSIRMSISMKSLAQINLNTAFTPTTFLSNDKFAQMLGLTDTQRDRIRDEIKTTTEELKYGSEEVFEKMRSLSLERWKRLLSYLNVKQQKQARELLGEPLQWFRAIGDQSLKGKDFTAGGTVVFGPNTQTAEGRSFGEMSLDELQKNGIELIHGHVYEMLRAQFIWDELELSESQRKKFSSKQFLDDKTVVLPNFVTQRADKLLMGEAKCSKSIIKVLVEHQQELFLQLELQLLLGKYESSVGLLHPRMVRTLSIGEKQIRDLTSVAEEYKSDASDLIEELGQKRDQITIEFRDDMVAILTQKQLDLFRQFTGSDFVSNSK